MERELSSGGSLEAGLRSWKMRGLARGLSGGKGSGKLLCLVLCVVTFSGPRHTNHDVKVAPGGPVSGMAGQVTFPRFGSCSLSNQGLVEKALDLKDSGEPGLGLTPSLSYL